MIRVYTFRGEVSHLLPNGASPNNMAAHTLCGLCAWPGYFRGTGSQNEEHRASQLKPCKHCERIANRDERKPNQPD